MRSKCWRLRRPSLQVLLGVATSFLIQTNFVAAHDGLLHRNAAFGLGQESGENPEDTGDLEHPELVKSGDDTADSENEMFYHFDHHSITARWLIFGCFMMLSLLVSHIVHRLHVSWLPESAVMVGIGALWGLIIKLRNPSWRQDNPEFVEAFGSMNQLVLNLVLLPPIIFESGWSLRWQEFLSQLPYVLTFAIAGTLISTFVIMQGILFSDSLLNHGISSAPVAFTFASLISAVDPVATLSTYGSLKVEPLLNTMVFGESTINDAVAIALFDAGNELEGNFRVLAIAGRMLWLLVGSSLFGFGFSWGISLLMEKVGLTESQDLGLTMLSLMPWFVYVAAEASHVSGIIATLFSGIYFAIWVKPRLDENGLGAKVSLVLKQASTVADATIFLFVGLAVMLLATGRRWLFALNVSFWCLVGRAAAVWPLGFLVNFVKRWRGQRGGASEKYWNTLSPSHLFMMWHAGLRGGIAVALVLQLKQCQVCRGQEGALEEQQKLREAAFFTTVAFLLVFGGSTEYFLKLCGIKCGDAATQSGLARMHHRPTVVVVPGAGGVGDHDAVATGDPEASSAEGVLSGGLASPEANRASEAPSSQMELASVAS